MTKTLHRPFFPDGTENEISALFSFIFADVVALHSVYLVSATESHNYTAIDSVRGGPETNKTVTIVWH